MPIAAKVLETGALPLRWLGDRRLLYLGWLLW